MIRVCFVCLGNICRSPTAAGVLRRLVDERRVAHRFLIESAGTGAWHVGELPDPRTRHHASKRGLVLDTRGRHFQPAFFDTYEHVLAMDLANRDHLLTLATTDAHRAKVALFRSFDPEAPPEAEVPDPYYGGPEGFEEVLDQCERAAEGFFAAVAARHGLVP